MPQNLPRVLEKELVKYKTRQGRKKADFVVAEGQRCCSEILKSQKCTIRYMLVADDGEISKNSHNFPVYWCSKEQFDTLSFTENSQGVMLIIERPAYATPQLKDPFLLVLDGLQEPGNMGTILRTALAVGLGEVALTKGTVDPFNPKSIRAGMGSQFNLRFSIFDSLSDLKGTDSLMGRNVWLTTPHGGISCYSDEFKLDNSLLVLGEEGGGIQDFSLGEKVMIPMPGNSESLNVAQAATIFMFEGVRQNLFTS